MSLVINHASSIIGIDDRYHFVCKNGHECQVRRLLDDYFDRLGDHFENTESLHTITCCDDYPWRSGRIQLSHEIDGYIRSLNLPSDGNDAFVSIVNEPNRKPPSKQRRLPFTTGKDATLPRGSDWNRHLYPSNKSAKSNTSPPSPIKATRSQESDATSTIRNWNA